MAKQSKFKKRVIDLEKKLNTYILYEEVQVGTLNIVEKLLERIEELEKKVDNK